MLSNRRWPGEPLAEESVVDPCGCGFGVLLLLFHRVCQRQLSPHFQPIDRDRIWGTHGRGAIGGACEGNHQLTVVVRSSFAARHVAIPHPANSNGGQSSPSPLVRCSLMTMPRATERSLASLLSAREGIRIGIRAPTMTWARGRLAK